MTDQRPMTPTEQAKDDARGIVVALAVLGAWTIVYGWGAMLLYGLALALVYPAAEKIAFLWHSSDR